MLNPKALLKTFIGKRPVEQLARERISLKNAVITYAIAFLIVKALLVFEIVALAAIGSFVSGHGIIDLVIGLVVLLVGLLVLVPVVFLIEFVFIYFLGAFQFTVASFYRKERGALNDFNASFIELFASIKLVTGLLLLVPLIGWVASAVAVVYGVVLNYRFIRERFNLNDAQSAIIVLIPTDLILAFLLLVAAMVSTFLIGTSIF